jgi:hypothetical protein
MTQAEREIRRKLRILQHAERSGNVSKTCRYYGVARLRKTREPHLPGERLNRPGKPAASGRSKTAPVSASKL